MSARAKKPTTKPPPPPGAGSRSSQMRTQYDKPTAASIEDQKTSIFDSGNFRKEPATPIKAISMKTPGATATPDIDTRPRPKVKLRAISEVTPLPEAQPKNLGYLAPPRDPHEAKQRRLRDYVVVASLSVIVASVIALIIWFAARQ